MKLLMIPLAMALSACNPLAIPTPPASPSAVANTTKLDEQAAISVELAYQAANRAVFFASRAGVLSADAKLRAADADNIAYKAVLGVRAAYDAGNATSYGAASVKAQQAVTTMLSITKES